MIGNDIVDLKKAALDSNWERSGYLKKICCAEEQQLILEASNPAMMLWLLWTMKESAYKAENRISNERRYAPFELLCKGITISSTNEMGQQEASAEVHYKNHIFHIRSFINSQMIHSICCMNAHAFGGINTYYLNTSLSCAQQFNELNPSFRFQKNKAGKPAVIHQLTGRSYASSVSHHGNYLAVIYSDSLLSAD